MKALLTLAFACAAMAQECRPIEGEGWQPMQTAPRNGGTVVELLETHGEKPWTGLFKWVPREGTPFGRWVRVDKPGETAAEDRCLFWRPVKSLRKD